MVGVQPAGGEGSVGTPATTVIRPQPPGSSRSPCGTAGSALGRRQPGKFISPLSSGHPSPTEPGTRPRVEALLGDPERGVHPGPHVLHADLIGQFDHPVVAEPAFKVGDLLVGDGLRVWSSRRRRRSPRARLGVERGGRVVVDVLEPLDVRPSSRINMVPKSTHQEQPTVRAVQKTASSRTFAGSSWKPFGAARGGRWRPAAQGGGPRPRTVRAPHRTAAWRSGTWRGPIAARVAVVRVRCGFSVSYPLDETARRHVTAADDFGALTDAQRAVSK